MVVIKIETDIASITASRIALALMLVIMYVKTFKTYIMVFIGDIIIS